MRPRICFAATGMALAAVAVLGGPAYAAPEMVPAAVSDVSIAWTTVGPYSTWGSCDSDRRLYQTRYHYKTQPCFLHTNGYYYFKYE